MIRRSSGKTTQWTRLFDDSTGFAPSKSFHETDGISVRQSTDSQMAMASEWRQNYLGVKVKLDPVPFPGHEVYVPFFFSPIVTVTNDKLPRKVNDMDSVYI